MKRVAIIGAGMSGLACAWYLLERGGFVPTIFDGVGIGGGASGAAAGLVHPYPGEQGRQSWMGHAALQETGRLVDEAEKHVSGPIAHRNGILRQKPLIQEYPDVERLSSSAYLIHSGMTISMPLYLEGLFRACSGALFKKRHITALEELSDYDMIIIAAGHGIFQFADREHLKVRAVKGHVLHCKGLGITRSVVGSGYLALGHVPGTYFVGSTYEKTFSSELASFDVAKESLVPKMSGLGADGFAVCGCSAGVRVSAEGHYLPKIERLGGNVWALTAMGSRGLLYHAYFARKLVYECI